MKKVFVLFCTLLVLASCNIENLNVESIQEENQEINLNITITRSDINADTKASVKQGWADGDVVFVFFKGVDAPKYLELKYNNGSWTATRMKADNPLTDQDIEEAYKGASQFTAVYMPYGSTLTVWSSVWGFTFNRNYPGHFYTAVNQNFSWNSETSTLTASIRLVAEAPIAEGDKLVHFDVEGCDAGHDYFLDADSKRSRYLLKQEYIKPISFLGIRTDGSVYKEVGAKGGEIQGLIDPNAFMSFSGVLDVSVVEQSVVYDFVVYDRIGQDGKQIYYYRDDIPAKTISKNTYIGLGDITGSNTKWKTRSGIFFSVGMTKFVSFAPANLVLSFTELNEGAPTNATWGFHSNQYEFVGPDAEDPTSTQKGKFTNLTGDGLFAHAGSFDHFGWVGGANTSFSGPLTQYGVSKSMTDADYAGVSLKSDWGNTITSDGYWRTPTKDEWAYLIDGRSDAYNKLGYATVCGVHGIIILPEIFTDPITNTKVGSNGKFIPRRIQSGDAQNTGWNQNVYTSEGWTAMQTAGAIFLPAAGYRDGNSMGRVKSDYSNPATESGFYSSSSPSDENKQYFLLFGSGNVDPAHSDSRYSGLCVRLIHNLN